ncbi:hypothetical protein [Burkholderia cenocepacia]|uniref:hypothetical protein n=1 Tax=Burkholderia cenocepacia TaxID=95486 RepID=UPI0021AB2EC9|nr:hypothetical protein [Burkholderia cenocepacia]
MTTDKSADALTYRKKPVSITAVQFTHDMAMGHVNLPEGVEFGGRNCHPGRNELHSHNHYIQTLEGRMSVEVGDWIITGVKGERYPCKPDIFAMTYEPVEQHEAAPAELGWRVRERRAPDGTLIDCFVEAPTEGDMPYAMEVLGDDYTGYGGIERKYEHCKLIVKLVNANAQPEPQAADERAALPQIPDLVKSMAWLTVCLRTELSRLDDTTHKALDEVEAQLSCVRAITNGAIDYEAMVAARASSPNAAGAEGVIYQISFSDEEGWCDTNKKVFEAHPLHARRIVYLAPAQAAEPVAWRYLTPTGWHATTDVGKVARVSAHHEVRPLFDALPHPAPASAPDGLTEPQIKAAAEKHWSSCRYVGDECIYEFDHEDLMGFARDIISGVQQ